MCRLSRRGHQEATKSKIIHLNLPYVSFYQYLLIQHHLYKSRKLQTYHSYQREEQADLLLLKNRSLIGA